ncbi:MAG: nitroreductase family protein [Phycisphaerae bacterium]|nr:nitroreductase family protein [Phycisphaerae bacterium]
MDVLNAIMNRRSVRAYSPKPIPADVMERMRKVLRAAPSACNNQPWHFIFVTDAELKKQVAKAARDQMWIADAPAIVVACGYPDKAYKKMGGYGNSVDIDLAIALDELMLAAASEGLGTCWIGAFAESIVKPLLGLPAEVKIVAMAPLGYPKTADLIRPLDELRRKSYAELFSENRFGNPGK